MFLKKLIQVNRHCHTKVPSGGAQTSSSDVWKSIIGLEIHAQLSTKTKLFSSAPAVYGAPTNSAVTLFDAAIPGTLPALNKKAVELAVISALALGCKVNPISCFDRKHYFYSDLPAGYQITQQRLPIAENGKVEYAIYQSGTHKEPYYKASQIKQIQLEQDSGKSMHENTENQSFIDLNRAGVALVEIVFQPDLEDADEACALVKEVIRILERVDSCSCKMEEGTFRVDANVSVHREGEEWGVRTEIKNIGSINGIWNAIRYEVKRQQDILKKGGTIKNETLSWDATLNKVKPMRDKEEKQDYRFMPEPNLPPLRLLIDEYSENIHKNVKSKIPILNLRHLKHKIPVLPQEERILLINKYGLNDIFAFNLVNQNKLFVYFKDIMTDNPSRDSKITYLLLMYQLLNALNSNNINLIDCCIRADHLGQIVDLLQTRRISKMTSDILLKEILKEKNSTTPIEIVERDNLGIISNPKELKKICLRIIEKEDTIVSAYKRKKKKTLLNKLMNKIIEESKFRADTQVLPRVLNEILEEISEVK